MVNSEMIRINELVNITSSGYIVKIYSNSKLTEVWPRICDEFLQAAQAHITEVFSQESQEVPQDPANLDKSIAGLKLLQHNDTSRATFQIPVCSGFPSLNRTMKFCGEFCDRIGLTHLSERRAPGQLCRVSYTAGRMNLEQAFLAYASHQRDTAHTEQN